MKRFLLLGLIIVLSNSVFGQNQITLQDAINVALQNNYQIQITQLQADQNKIYNTWGEAGRYPSVTLSGS
ncbi:MAG: hypothetical protein JKY54_15150, partial [Flavobacteriales bacterium]|nr:hypothetical protein [Flavobacteriales bacterium]